MPTTVPTIVCGRCGTPFVNTAVCGNCAHPTTATWPFDAEEWRTRLRPASQERVILALALDALCLLVPVVALAVAATRSGWHPWAIALVVVTLLALLSGLGLWCLRDWGRFAGGAALRLRTLDSLTGLAPARPMAPRRLLVADSRGDDPLLITVPHLGDPRTIAKPPSPVPVYLSGPKGKGGRELWVRAGNSTQRLEVDDAVTYVAQRWPHAVRPSLRNRVGAYLLYHRRPTGAPE